MREKALVRQVISQPSGFEPLKFYCRYIFLLMTLFAHQPLTLLHSERPKLYGVWAILSATELKEPSKIAADDSYILLLLSLVENKA